jgi:FkbM family methyltransferase
MTSISYSQLEQDLWVLNTLNSKKNGYFVEIGAHNGVDLSNTYMFEKYYNWNGMCIEANPHTYNDLIKNRKCVCVNALLDSGNYTKSLNCIGEMSFISNENNSSFVKKLEDNLVSNNIKYDVIKQNTCSLESVFNSYDVPDIIDYMSIDIEGMEYDVLKVFPFSKYHINTLTVEHNAPHYGVHYREKLRDLLENNNFTFVKGNDDIHNWGHDSIDDFYVNIEIK